MSEHIKKISTAGMTPGEMLRARTSRPVVIDSADSAWVSLGDIYTSIAENIDPDGRPEVIVTSSGDAFSDLKRDPNRLTINGSVLGSSLYKFDASNPAHKKSLLLFHGLFLHEMSHLLFTKWEPMEATDEETLIVNILEDLRVDSRMSSFRRETGEWLRASAALKTDQMLSSLRSRHLPESTLALMVMLETFGRALTGTFRKVDADSMLKVLDETLPADAVERLRDVLAELVIVPDHDGARILELARILLNAAKGEGLSLPGAEGEEGSESEEGSEGEGSESESGESKDSSGEKSDGTEGASEDSSGEGESGESKDGESGESGSDGSSGDGEGSEKGESGEGEGEREGSGEGEGEGEGESGGSPGSGEGSDESSSSGATSLSSGSGETKNSTKASKSDGSVKSGAATTAPASSRSRESLLKELSPSDLEALKKAMSSIITSAGERVARHPDSKVDTELPANVDELVKNLKAAVDNSKEIKALTKKDASKVDSREFDSDESMEGLEGSHGFGYGGSTKHGRRAPSSKERIIRTQLSVRLRKAKYRTRSITETSSILPPGRLRTRELLKGAAQKAEGRIVTAKPWRGRHHRSVEEPKLRVGILCDVSGSMSSVVGPVSSSMWATAAAVVDNGGTSVGISFGDHALLAIDKGYKAPEEVITFPADGGMEAIYDALKIAKDSLDLDNVKTSGNSPRILIIVSDGYWVDGAQSRAADNELKRLMRNGVKIIHVGLGSEPQKHPGDLTVVIKTPSEIPKVISEACIKVVSTS